MTERFLISDMGKLKILAHLKGGKWHSYYDLQKALGVNYDSLKKQLKFLEMIGLVELSAIEPADSSTGRGSYKVRITGKGRELAR